MNRAEEELDMTVRNLKVVRYQVHFAFLFCYLPFCQTDQNALEAKEIGRQKEESKYVCVEMTSLQFAWVIIFDVCNVQAHSLGVDFSRRIILF